MVGEGKWYLMSSYDGTILIGNYETNTVTISCHASLAIRISKEVCINTIIYSHMRVKSYYKNSSEYGNIAKKLQTVLKIVFFALYIIFKVVITVVI